MRRTEAFTLVELLVVVAIIALLVALLSPSLQRAKERARIAVCKSQLHQMGVGLRTYAARSTDRSMPPGNSTSWPGFGIDSTWSSSYGPMGLAILITEEIVPAPQTFYCPSWKHPYHRFGALDTTGVDPCGGPNDYGGWPDKGPGPNRHRGISYQYRSTFGLKIDDPAQSRGKPPDLKMGGNPAIAADHWTRRYVLLGNYGHDDGYPTLYLDGSSAWTEDQGHAFMDEMCEYQSHGNWAKQEFLWNGFFDLGR